MLDILRKKASSWITKFLLGLIAVVFAVFFGYTGLQKSSPNAAVAGLVNGEPIFQNEVDQLVQNQTESWRQKNKEEIPDSLLPQVRQAAVNFLVEDRIIRDAAKKLGMRVSEGEVYKKLSTDPNLAKDGKFNAEHYKTVFRPWFLNRTGVDYEEILRREILKEKFTSLFERAVYVSDEDLKNRYRAEHLKIRVKSVEINPSKLATGDKSSGEEMKKRADALAEEFWPLFLKGKSIAGRLKANNLSETESGLVGIAEAGSLFGGAFDAEAVSTLFRLTKKNPYPPSPLKVGPSTWLVRLISREEADLTALEKNRDEELKKYKSGMGDRFYRSWYMAERDKAKIKINEQP
ncbi:MAG: SurA N-terminal domain-containing protein [Deltaproteobacteria bacterium]|nr:SurA N-terminal domain-containing protein [Deltaproteobacteria bacterium]